MQNDGRSMLLRVVRKVPWLVMIAFYFPAIVMALGSAALFSVTHRRIFGCPVDVNTASGRVGNAIWMPTMISVMIIGVGIALTETALVLWWITVRLGA